MNEQPSYTKFKMMLEPSDVISGVGLWFGISGGVGSALLIILSVTHRRTQPLTWFVISIQQSLGISSIPELSKQVPFNSLYTTGDRNWCLGFSEIIEIKLQLTACHKRLFLLCLILYTCQQLSRLTMDLPKTLLYYKEYY